MNLQLAESAAEFDMPLIRQVLPEKDAHEVVVKGALDFADPRIVDVTCEIEGDLRTASSTAFRDRELHSCLLLPACSADGDGLHSLLSHMGFDGISTVLSIRSEPPMAQILVAESDRLIRQFIAGILNDFGHHVTVCADSAEATAFLAIGSIGVVLTDLGLGSGA